MSIFYFQNWIKSNQKISKTPYQGNILYLRKDVPFKFAKSPDSDRGTLKTFLHYIYHSPRDGFLNAGLQLSQLSHPNLAGIVGFSRQDDPICIISEYTEYGDLCQFYQNQSSGWSSQNILEFR